MITSRGLLLWFPSPSLLPGWRRSEFWRAEIVAATFEVAAVDAGDVLSFGTQFLKIAGKKDRLLDSRQINSAYINKIYSPVHLQSRCPRNVANGGSTCGRMWGRDSGHGW